MCPIASAVVSGRQPHDRPSRTSDEVWVGHRRGRTLHPMPWIDVTEPHARPPKLPRASPGRATATLIAEDGWAELTDGVVNGDQLLDLPGLTELSIVDCQLTAVTLPPNVEVELRRTTIDDGDLSQVRFRSMRGARLTGCKMVGTDLSATAVADTILTGCSLRLANLRMATLQRVAFVDCELRDVDAYQLAATDVSFDGSTLELVNVDALEAERVDLRGAAELSLKAASSLRGCLVAEHQLPALAYSLALAAGVDIESSSPTDLEADGR